jgi:hypothetical protein
MCTCRKKVTVRTFSRATSEQFPASSKKNITMKNILTLMLVFSVASAFSQSKSFEILCEKFKGENDVTSVSVGGFLLKTAIWLSGEKELRNEVGDIKSVRLINIPQREITRQNLHLSGFKKVLAKDNFEEVLLNKDKGELITVYICENQKASNLYFFLIEEADEVTAIEIKGHLDPRKIIEERHHKKTRL